MDNIQPLMVCMDNASGEEVTLRVEPEDDCRAFIDKARSVLGYDIDLTSLLKYQEVDLNENAYKLLHNLSKNNPEMIQEQDEPGNSESQGYVLDDGTEIEASQIQFNNDDALIDLTLEKLPFVKVNNDSDDEIIAKYVEDITYKEVKYVISASPEASVTNSPKSNFLNSVPFRLVTYNTINSGVPFKRCVEENTKTYANVPKNKSPRSLIKDDFANEQNVVSTRDKILNMLKDAPVISIPYEVNENKHVRKTDPTRMVQKNTSKNFGIGRLNNNDVQNQNCFICRSQVTDKNYITDKEENVSRLSPTKRDTSQLKVICEYCLSEYFMPSRMKNYDQNLTPTEYVVIKNDQQYIFQMIKNFRLQSSGKKTKKKRIKDEFVNVEIGSDGEIVTKPIDKDDVSMIIDGKSSSDVELVEEPEMDQMIENIEEADEELKKFLGIGKSNGGEKEMKCRFCELLFQSPSEVALHSGTHKHDTEVDIVFPCPLCDYGYASFQWLNAHVKVVHEKKEDAMKKPEDLKNNENDVKVKVSSGSDEKKEDKSNNNGEDDKQLTTAMKPPDLVIKTEVKLEALSSDDEIWVVQSDEAPVKARKGHKCHICSKFFPSPETLATHKCRRGVKRPTEDIQPEKKFTEECKKKENSEPLSCQKCNQSFTSKVRLRFHMQFHTRDAAVDTYACGECDLICDTEAELFDHVHFQHEKKRKLLCPQPMCGKTFHLRATLTKHSRTHTDTRRYVCVTCGKRFFDKQTLDEHSVTHLQIKPYQCHICLKHLTRISRLRMHMRAHQQAAPARAPVCRQCGRVFRDVQQAQEHALKSAECLEACAAYEEEDNPTLQLSPTTGIITHVFREPKSPEPPKRIKHQVASPIAEPLLSKLTTEARNLIRVVEIDKAFRCEYCEDVFYIEEGLNKHREIHRGVKNPFICHICKVSFATYSRCTTHKTTHGIYKKGTETAPDFPVVKHFLCEDCGRSYLHWTYLQVHRRMKHLNENYVYKCNECEMAFVNSWSLNYHRRKMHTAYNTTRNYRIPCRDCDEVLPNKIALYKHRIQNHSEDSVSGFEPGTSDCGILNTQSGGRSAWACPCGARFVTRYDLRTHISLEHTANTSVIEVQGGNKTREELMNIVKEKVPGKKIDKVELMTFKKGTTSIVPSSARALSLLSNVPRITVNLSQPPNDIEKPAEDFQNRRPINILPNFRRPAILQRTESQQANHHNKEAITQNLQQLVQFKIPDCITRANRDQKKEESSSIA